MSTFSEHLNDVTKVFPLDVIVRFDKDLPQDGFADGIVLGIELVKPMEGVAVLQEKDVVHWVESCQKARTLSALLIISCYFSWACTHCMHVQGVHTEVKGGEVHTLKHLHERLTFASLHMHNLPRILLHGSFDKPQKVLLVHTGRGVDMCVDLYNNPIKQEKINIVL